VEHRLTGEDLPATVAAHQGEAKLRLWIVVFGCANAGDAARLPAPGIRD